MTVTRHIKIAVILMKLGLFLALTFTTASAAVNSIPRYGFLGGTTAWATMEAFPTYGNPVNCRITSSTSPSTIINVIGWTWWQCELLNSSGTIISVSYGGARAVTSYSTSATISFSSVPAGTKNYRTRGTHDFNHPGASPSPWRPYNSVTN